MDCFDNQVGSRHFRNTCFSTATIQGKIFVKYLLSSLAMSTFSFSPMKRLPARLSAATNRRMNSTDRPPSSIPFSSVNLTEREAAGLKEVLENARIPPSRTLSRVTFTLFFFASENPAGIRLWRTSCSVWFLKAD